MTPFSRGRKIRNRQTRRSGIRERRLKDRWKYIAGKRTGQKKEDARFHGELTDDPLKKSNKGDAPAAVYGPSGGRHVAVGSTKIGARGRKGRSSESTQGSGGPMDRLSCDDHPALTDGKRAQSSLQSEGGDGEIPRCRGKEKGRPVTHRGTGRNRTRELP